MTWPAWVWNALTTTVTVGVLAFTVVGLGDTWAYVPPTLLTLFTLRWAFPTRRFTRWHTFLGWVYAGLLTGAALWLTDHVTAVWHALVLVPVLLTLGVVLPGAVRDRYWTLRMVLARPAPWSYPQGQTRAEVIDRAPIRIVAVTETTEQVRAGVVQDRQVSTRYELQAGGVVVTVERTLKDAEDWLLTLYRRYRKLRRLPVAPALQPDITQIVREEVPLSLYTTPEWQRGHLTPAQVLAWSPYSLRLASEHWTADVTYQPDGTRHLWGEEPQAAPRAHAWSDRPALPSFASGSDVPGALRDGEVSVVLLATGEVMSRHAGLRDAEAEVLRLYAQQCPVDAWMAGPEPGVDLSELN